MISIVPVLTHEAIRSCSIEQVATYTAYQVQSGRLKKCLQDGVGLFCIACHVLIICMCGPCQQKCQDYLITHSKNG